MKTLNVFLNLSAIAVSALFLTSISGEAARTTGSCQSLGLTKAECSCQHALDMGSRSALRRFLVEFPRADTACNASASTAELGDGNKGGSSSGGKIGSSGSSTSSSGSSTSSSGSSTSSSGSSTSSSGSSSSSSGGHDNKGLGNGNEGECHGQGCSDPDNPGHKK